MQSPLYYRWAGVFVRSRERISEIVARHPVITRWILAGPITIIASMLIMAGMALWVPQGAAKLNNIALPIIGLPIIWAACFFYICIEENLPRAVTIMAILILGHIILVASAF